MQTLAHSTANGDTNATTTSRRGATRTLFVTAAIGRARTELAAFDHALTVAGAADRNLIRLSSVIPPASEVIATPRIPASPGGQWGDRLYAVYAEQRTSRIGAQVWAGVGWITEPLTGRGLFVEHEGHDERIVRGQIAHSLADLSRHRDVEFGLPRSLVIGATCTELPTCALVVCAYAVEPWHQATQINRRRPSRRTTEVRR
jgi:arginine decarboxylase